jgi:16S rRNA (guanine527-N7)-methyltransferase
MRAGTTVALDWIDLPALFPAFPDPERWLPLLRRHAALLAEAAEHTRVSAVAAADIVQRQYAESLEVLRITETERPASGTLVDVGSGGGFPGLVIAAVRPTVEVHLVEPLRKRARLLEQCARELGLRNVTVHALRAEDAGRGPLRDAADVVTARAVAELRVLLEYTAPLTATGGLMALPKGSGAQAELVGAAHALRDLHCEKAAIAAMRPEISTTLVVALFRKLAPTPPGYPRRAGVAAKRPL